jgi:hypothetical protein
MFSARCVDRLPRASGIVVRIRVGLVLFLRPRQQIYRELFRTRIGDDEVVHRIDPLCVVRWTVDLLPANRRDEILLAKHFIHQTAKPVHFVVVDGDEDRAVVAEEFAQQL